MFETSYRCVEPKARWLEGLFSRLLPRSVDFGLFRKGPERLPDAKSCDEHALLATTEGKDGAAGFELSHSASP
jgi:hypothetical protein